MSEIDLLISARKYIRSQVTIVYNNRLSLVISDRSEKLKLCTKVNNYLVKLQEYDNKIQNLLWSTESQSEKKLHDEMSKCEEYFDKINDVLNLINTNDIPAAHNVDTARSMLKSYCSITCV